MTARRRFVAKRDGDVWRPYDRDRATYPLDIPGYGMTQAHATEQDAADEAQLLEDFYGLADGLPTTEVCS